jgi:hypothetical protein
VSLKLIHLEQRIKELETLANEIHILAKRVEQEEDVQPDLSMNGQMWYRGAREILVQQNFSGLDEFDSCYNYYQQPLPNGYPFFVYGIQRYISGTIDFESSLHRSACFNEFSRQFTNARALLLSVISEINSRELPITTELSFHISTNEFKTAKDIFDKYNNEEILIRVSGIVARVALERHIRTVSDTRKIVIIKNPPNKPHDDFTDVTTSLLKERVITSHQKSELDLLYRTGNDCAHPQGQVIASNIKQLIERGRELASMIL